MMRRNDAAMIEALLQRSRIKPGSHLRQAHEPAGIGGNAQA